MYGYDAPGRDENLIGDSFQHRKICHFTIPSINNFSLDFVIYLGNIVVVMKKLNGIIRLSIILTLIIGGPAYADRLPTDLTESCDPVLQKGLEKCLISLNLKKATHHKSLSIVLVDITNPSSPRMAYVNPNEMMYAAKLAQNSHPFGGF